MRDGSTMRSLLLTAALAALALLVAAPAGASAAACPGADAVPAAGRAADVAGAALCLLNAERARHGLAALTANSRLEAAAARHAADMVERRYFAHESPEGRRLTDRIRATGYLASATSWVVGENLAWGTGSRSTPREVVAAWMASPGHRDNVLRARYREIGLGIVSGTPRAGDGAGATYATTFGARSGAGRRAGRSAKVAAGDRAARFARAQRRVGTRS